VKNCYKNVNSEKNTKYKKCLSGLELLRKLKKSFRDRTMALPLPGVTINTSSWL
jgi:hypothetical protein